MIEFEWIAPRGLREYLRTTLGPLLEDDRHAHLGHQEAPEDPEMAAILRWELAQGVRSDREVLQTFLADPALGSDRTRIEVAQAEAMVRALANLRLHLRTHQLAEIADEQLEQGDSPSPEAASQPVARYYPVYALLGSLQQLLLDLLDAHEAAAEEAED